MHVPLFTFYRNNVIILYYYDLSKYILWLWYEKWRLSIWDQYYPGCRAVLYLSVLPTNPSIDFFKYLWGSGVVRIKNPLFNFSSKLSGLCLKDLLLSYKSVEWMLQWLCINKPHTDYLLCSCLKQSPKGTTWPILSVLESYLFIILKWRGFTK